MTSVHKLNTRHGPGASRIVAWVSQDLLQALDARADKEMITRTHVITLALRAYLKPTKAARADAA